MTAAQSSFTLSVAVTLPARVLGPPPAPGTGPTCAAANGGSTFGVGRKR